LEAKVLDFGVSKFLSQPQLQTVDLKGAIIGSVNYISPEQLELKPLDPRSDLYYLGCILYFCLTQEPPFDGGSPAETVRSHLEHDVTPLHLVRPDVPQIVSDWVMKLIERNPDDRPLGARDALSLLDRVAELEHVPDARLEDLEEETAPLSAGTLSLASSHREESGASHHLAPAAIERENSSEKATH
ncbi:MAG: hypothetical protein AAF491_06790, partial [Verrucomicrobiota bacterium]